MAEERNPNQILYSAITYGSDGWIWEGNESERKKEGRKEVARVEESDGQERAMMMGLGFCISTAKMKHKRSEKVMQKPG